MPAELLLLSAAIAAAASFALLALFQLLVVEFALLDVCERIEDNAPRRERNSGR